MYLNNKIPLYIYVKATEEEAENYNSDVVDACQLDFKEKITLIKASSNIAANVVNEIAIQEAEKKYV